MIAWPASWNATMSRISPFMAVSLLDPIVTRWYDSSTMARVMIPSFVCTARIAASFKRFARSAPLNPVVIPAISSSLTSPSKVFPRACTPKIRARPSLCGREISSFRSNRPGLMRASSSVSTRFVAASTMMPLESLNPSISVNSWVNVPSRSSLPPNAPKPLFLPMASISSMKMMHGSCCLASSNKLRTLDAPTPTNISTKAEPDTEIKGTSLSPAIARAKRVFPQPGTPLKIAPFGTRAPFRLKRMGSFKN